MACVLALAGLAATARPALGFLYSEHREITGRGLETLDPARQAILASLWSAAREGEQARLCENPSAGIQGLKPSCVDLAAWGALAADHSCSPRELLRTILESDWVLNVAAVASKTEAGIRRARNANERRNVQTKGDLGLERADKEYSSRAGANNAHFLLPRSSSDPGQYAIECLSPGAPPNAMALYAMLHAAAMHRIAAPGEGEVSPAERTARVRSAFALEAFALHFLEDSFAAGHIAGSWGVVAERKGTHDFYNENGLDTDNWKHEPMLLFGDAHMSREDLERAGEAVRASLSQVLDASVPGSSAGRDAGGAIVPPEMADGSFDVCTATGMPEWQVSDAMRSRLAEVIRETPIPFRGPGFASLPRFRAEIGPFVGVVSGVSGASADGGLPRETTAGPWAPWTSACGWDWASKGFSATPETGSCTSKAGS